MVKDTAAQKDLLVVDRLHTVFETQQGSVRAVRDVSLSVPKGTMVGLVGETGCGKSSVLRSIIGLIRPPGSVAGRVWFEGIDLLAQSPRTHRSIRGKSIGFVPQDAKVSLNPILRVERQFKNVIGAHRRGSRQEYMRLMTDALESVELADIERVRRAYPHELSGGMAQRVGIALALVLHPRLVLADEPTAGVDATVRREILDLLVRTVREERSRSMLLVTHDLGIVEEFCDRVIVMYGGTVVEEGDAKQVFKAPTHPYTRDLVAAIPRKGRALRGISGAVPSALEEPLGCLYAPRCSLAHARCETESPLIRMREDGRRVSCHLDLE